jgi:hypothetical protein
VLTSISQNERGAALFLPYFRIQSAAADRPAFVREGSGRHTKERDAGPRILADYLDVPKGRIRLVQGDTDLIPLRGAHGSLRAANLAAC